VSVSANNPPVDPALAGPVPTDTVGHGQQTQSHPAGSALPEGGIPLTERPEALVGAAFAGGLAFALILKRLAR
jgi:hypothetical protein